MVPMLAERGWRSCYLDGSTKNRGEVVKRFQENEDIPVLIPVQLVPPVFLFVVLVAHPGGFLNAVESALAIG